MAKADEAHHEAAVQACKSHPIDLEQELVAVDAVPDTANVARPETSPILSAGPAATAVQDTGALPACTHELEPVPEEALPEAEASIEAAPAAATPSSDAGSSPDTDQQVVVDHPAKSTRQQQHHLTPELEEKIRQQVEFWFSDANLPTDEFLLSYVQADPEGFVPLRVIASFRKIQALTRKTKWMAAALRSSTTLALSEDSQRVRRREALPLVDLDEVRRRTVLADNLPLEKPTIEWVMEVFGRAGEVVMARIRKPGQPETLLSKGLRAELQAARSDRTYALVEYRSAAEAARAVELLHQPNNWRSGMRVRPLLLQQQPQHHRNDHHGGGGSSSHRGAGRRSTDGRRSLDSNGGGSRRQSLDTEGRSRRSVDGSGGGGSSGGLRRSLDHAHTPAADGAAAAGGGEAAGSTRPVQPWQQKRHSRADYASWASASAARQLQQQLLLQQQQHGVEGGAGAQGAAANGNGNSHHHHPFHHNACANGGSKLRQPVMPDGKRGFGVGRGTVLALPAGLVCAPGAPGAPPA